MDESGVIFLALPIPPRSPASSAAQSANRAKSLSIVSGAQIDGKTSFKGQKEPSVAQTRNWRRPRNSTKIEHRHEKRGGGYYLWRIIWTATFILFGLVLASLMPKICDGDGGFRWADWRFVRPGRAGLLRVFIASFIACFTIVGMLVGISSLMLWMVMLFAAEVVIGGIVGQWIMGRDDEFWPFFLRGLFASLQSALLPASRLSGSGRDLRLRCGEWAPFRSRCIAGCSRHWQPNIPPPPVAPLSSPLPPNTTVGGI